MLEVELGLPDNVEDSELVTTKAAIEKSLKSAQEAVKKQKMTEAKAAEESKPKEEEAPKTIFNE